RIFDPGNTRPDRSAGERATPHPASRQLDDGSVTIAWSPRCAVAGSRSPTHVRSSAHDDSPAKRDPRDALLHGATRPQDDRSMNSIRREVRGALVALAASAL